MKVKLGRSRSFHRAFQRKIGNNAELERKFWERLKRFEQDPFDPALKTHKLSGELEGLWSFSVDYDCRIIFKFVNKDKVLLIDTGSHDEVY